MGAADTPKSTAPSVLVLNASIDAAAGLLDEDKPEAALALLEPFRGRPLPPDLEERWLNHYARAAVRVGILRYQAGDYSGGATLLARAVEMRPDSLTIRANAGAFAYNACQYDLTVKYLGNLPRDLSELNGEHLQQQYRAAVIHSAAILESVPRERYRQELRDYLLLLLDQGIVRRSPGRSPGHKIRIGYLAGLFGVRNTNALLPAIFENHDRSRFAIYAYSTGDRNVDPVIRDRIRCTVDHWCDLTSMDDDSAIEQMLSDQLDILIDVDGACGPRIAVVAAHPAAVVGGWWHAIETCGIKIYDFVLSDDVLITPEERAEWCEEIVYVPGCFTLWRPVDLPSRFGGEQPPCIRNGYVTFGCYGNPARITGVLAAAWAEILAAYPGSRLVLRYGDLELRQLRARCEALLSEAGVDLSRVDMIGYTPLEELLASYDGIDLCLDTYPAQAANTLLDAMMQGVPTIVCSGDAPRSRMGPTLLRATGQTELVAYSLEEYSRKAIELARSPERLAMYRRELRPAVERSCLMHPELWMRGVEEALADVVERLPAGASRG
jgi:predicted O-linked N-acetylglucosamine transferase (SPINDLY family)